MNIQCLWYTGYFKKGTNKSLALHIAINSPYTLAEVCIAETHIQGLEHRNGTVP